MLKIRYVDVTAQHCDLVAQHEELDLRGLVTPQQLGKMHHSAL